MKEAFIERAFQTESEELLAHVDAIITEYAAQGYDLSLRQLYYQMVSRDLLPDRWRDKKTGSKNNLRSYKNLGNLINDARLAGLIDWDTIVDRGRKTVKVPSWGSQMSFFRTVPFWFSFDKWLKQPVHIEVMVEKDALSGVLLPVCNRHEVRFTANKGYPSSSILYTLSKRLTEARDNMKDVVILHLGDHDPSGIDMTRDLVDRLELFAGASINVQRLALNMDQVEQYDPPENPTKTTDSRSDSYITLYGTSSWELDALRPEVLAELVESFILENRDEELWEEAIQEEEEMTQDIKAFLNTYSSYRSYGR